MAITIIEYSGFSTRNLTTGEDFDGILVDGEQYQIEIVGFSDEIRNNLDTWDANGQPAVFIRDPIGGNETLLITASLEVFQENVGPDGTSSLDIYIFDSFFLTLWHSIPFTVVPAAPLPPILTSVDPSSSDALTIVTFTGANFRATSVPYFAPDLSQPAFISPSFQVINSTQISVTVPNLGPGPVSVFVNDQFFNSNVLPFVVTQAVITGPPGGGEITPPVVVVPPPPPALIAITVIPAVATLTEGQSSTFVAIGTYDDGSVLTLDNTNTAPAWTVSNFQGTGSIDPNSGFFVAAIAGGVTVFASVPQGITGSAQVTIAQRPIPPSILETLTVIPTLPTVVIGQSMQFHVQGLSKVFGDISGQIVSNQQVTFPPVTWTVTNGTGQGTIDTHGNFTATDLQHGLTAKFWNGTLGAELPPGNTGEIARTPDFESIMGPINIANGAAPAGINATSFFGRFTGYIIPTLTGTYTIGTNADDGANVFINGQGLFFDLQDSHVASPGLTYTRSGSIALTAGVRYPIVVEWHQTVSVYQLQLLWTPPGEVTQLIPLNVMETDSGNGSQCVVTAEATDGSGITASQVVTIVGTALPPAPVAGLVSIAVTPKTALVPSGSNQQFSIIGTDQFGIQHPVNVVWSIINGQGAGTIDPHSGLFFAEIAGGGITVTATTTIVPQLTDTASVVVAAGSVVKILVTPSSTLLETGQGQQFTATGYDAFGNAKILGNVVWTVIGGVGTITSGGLFTATTSGVGKVQAVSGSISGTATVNVQQVLGGVAIKSAKQVPFGRVHIRNTVDAPLVIDTRNRGGGLRSSTSIDLGDDFWWDLTSFDGAPFAMYGVFAAHVFLPAGGGQIADPNSTIDRIQNVFSKYAAPQFLGVITPDSSLPRNLAP